MSTRIVLADDHALMRQSLRAILVRQPDLQVVAEAEDGLVALQRVQELMPDIVIMDVVMPRLHGLEATRQIVASHPAIKVIGLSIHADTRFVEGMLHAGAVGYLLKGHAFAELVRAVRTVLTGQRYISPHIPGIAL